MTAAALPLAGSLAVRHAVQTLGNPAHPPLVLAHGFGTDQQMWRWAAPAFSGDRRVVLFDHAGAGRAAPDAWSPSRHASLHGYAEDVVALLEELALGPVSFVGHSASAMIGLLAAVERPDLFTELVMVGGSPSYLDDDAGGYRGGFSREDVDGLLLAMETDYESWALALAPTVMGNDDRPELAEELAASFVRTDARAAKGFARALFLSDHRDAVPLLRVPALVVQPAEDPMVPEGVAHWLHEQIPDATLALLDATGHFPHVSGVDETARVVRDFLQRRR